MKEIILLSAHKKFCEILLVNEALGQSYSRQKLQGLPCRQQSAWSQDGDGRPGVGEDTVPAGKSYTPSSISISSSNSTSSFSSTSTLSRWQPGSWWTTRTGSSTQQTCSGNSSGNIQSGQGTLHKKKAFLFNIVQKWGGGSTGIQMLRGSLPRL